MHSAVLNDRIVTRSGPRRGIGNNFRPMAHGSSQSVNGHRVDPRRTMGSMALSLPSPSALFELSRYAAGQVIEQAASLATLPVRAIGVLSQAELLVSRITVIAEQA